MKAGLLKRRTRSGESPHVVVMSAGLWHMLHIHSPADFAKQLQRLKQAMKTFLTHNKVGAHIRSTLGQLLQPDLACSTKFFTHMPQLEQQFAAAIIKSRPAVAHLEGWGVVSANMCGLTWDNYGHIQGMKYPIMPVVDLCS